MELLTAIFRTLVRMSLLALPVMAVVLSARWLLARAGAPKRYAYALWAVVGFRLLLPPGLFASVPWSVFNLCFLRPVARAAGAMGSATAGHTVPGGVLPLLTPFPAAAVPLPDAASIQSAGLAPSELAVGIAAVVWLAGLGAVAAYSVLSDLRLRRRLSDAVLRDGNVYECGGIAAPFVLGVLRPRIYIPFRLDDDRRTYVLCHERTHLARHDPWFKLLAFALCAVYWWNPAVWGCNVLFCRDMEMSCDEAVLRRLGPEAKRGYSLSLVDFAAARHFPSPGPLAFGEHDAGRRVKNVLRWRRAAPRAVFLAAALCALAVAVCCSNAWESGCRVRLTGAQNALGVTYTCRFPQPVRTWAVFEDVYEEGRLLSSTPRITGGVDEVRDFTRTLTWSSPDNGSGGFSGPLTCHSSVEGGEETVWQIDLPKPRYTGWGAVTGDDAGQPGRRSKDTFTLGDEGEMTLLTVIGSTAENGGVTSYNAYGGVEAANDTVVRFRLAVSAGDVSALRRAHTASGVSQLARTLYGLKTPYVGDASADAKLLGALGVGELGGYQTELFTAGEPYVLQIDFSDDPGAGEYDRLDAAMRQKALAALALIDNLDQVRWRYPKRADLAGENTGAAFLDRAAADGLASELGFADARTAGQSPEGIQTLLEGGGTAAGTVTGETPSGAVPYPAMGGYVAQLACDLPDTVGAVTLECVTYHGGAQTADTVTEPIPVERTSFAGAVARTGRLWLTCYPRRSAGGWDKADFRLLRWSDADSQADSSLASWSADIPAPPAGESYDRAETSLYGTLGVAEDSDIVLFAACFRWGSGADPVPLSEARLNDADALAEAVAANDTVLVVRMRLSPAEP